MKAFEVFVNGRRLCVAGIGNNGVLSAIVNWVGKAGAEDLFMRLGGLDSTTDEHLRWAVPSVRLGDEVCIRIVEVDQADSPTRYPGDWEGDCAE